jgi:hypothetical protein
MTGRRDDCKERHGHNNPNSLPHYLLSPLRIPGDASH